MKRLSICALAVIAIFALGCAKERKNNGAIAPPTGFIPDAPYVPPTDGPGSGPGANWEYGGTTELTASNSALSAYLGWTVNTPEELRVNVNLVKVGEGFGGVVTIGFQDNGKYYEDYFTSLIFNSWSRVDSDEENNKYNIWFNKNGQLVWHGFFQDYYGGLVVVIDDVVDLGDGQGPQGPVSGSIWYKSFPFEYSPIPPTSCWFVSLGPYDCRAWKDGEGVNTTKGIYPDNGYKKLGDFQGLELDEAFNGEANL